MQKHKREIKDLQRQLQVHVAMREHGAPGGRGLLSNSLQRFEMFPNMLAAKKDEVQQPEEVDA